MSAATFDTFGAVHDLEAAGFERRQVEAVNRGDERTVTKNAPPLSRGQALAPGLGRMGLMVNHPPGNPGRFTAP